MSLFAVAELFVATTADVSEGLTLLEVVLVRLLLFASRVVEVHTDLVITHVVLRDTVYVGLALLALVARLAAGVGFGIPLSVLESVILRSLRVSRLDVLKTGLDERPVGPLELHSNSFIIHDIIIS